MLLSVLMSACVVPDPLPVDERFDPSILYVAGTFGYDPAESEAVPYTLGADTVPVTVNILALDARWFDDGTDSRLCSIALSTTTPLAQADWVGEAAGAAAFGFTMPEDATADGSCPEWDPDVWGDLEGVLTAGPWGLGVGALDDAVEARARADVQANGGDWSEDWAPWTAGGGFHLSALRDELPGGFASNNTAVAYEADAAMAVVLDSDGRATPLTAEAALDLPRAVWVVDLVYGVDAAFVMP